MAKSIITEGKTSNEAIEKGLKELNCKKEDVEIKVLENEEKKVFFSILAPRVVRVELTVKSKNNEEHKSINTYVSSKEDILKCKNNIEKFLKDFSNEVSDITYDIAEKDASLLVNIDGEGANKLIGYRGEVINSLQNLLCAIGNKSIEKRVRIILDICNYREKREKDLYELANKLEKTVVRTGKRVTLEPMTAYERKILHTALQNSKTVTTYSIGEEPHRKVVVDKKQN